LRYRAIFDDKVLALYARGMTVREIQRFLADLYGVEVSPDLISTVTDGSVAEITAWQTRPLDRCIRWCSSMRPWRAAMTQFAVLYQERFVVLPT
jgi:transposase-like protein